MRHSKRWRGISCVLVSLTAICAGAAAGSGAEETGTPTPDPRGPVALYTFQEGGGALVRDESGVTPPLDLEVRGEGVRWLEGGGIEIHGPSVILSRDLPDKITQACQAANALTVEVWLRPANTAQAGPARVVSVSAGTSERNFTLGQEGSAYAVRLRTTTSNLNGLPEYRTPEGMLDTALTHLVYVRRPDGMAALHVNGTAVPLSPDRPPGGDFSNWAQGYPLMFAGEGHERSWLGELHAVAIYARALEPAEFSMSPEQLRAATPPRIEQMRPAYGTARHGAGGGLRFEVTARAPNRVVPESITVELNGQDVSGALALEAAGRGFSAVYRGLEPGQVYAGRIRAADAEGRTAQCPVLFDTFETWAPRRMSEPGPVLAPVHEPVDLLVPLEGPHPADGFQVELTAIVSGPANRRMAVPAFYKAPGLWCVRFAPTLEGEWTLETVSSEPRLAGRTIRVVAGPNPNPNARGRLEVHPEYPLHFRFEDGTPYLLLGYEVDWLWALDQTAPEPERLRHFLGALAGGGFNHLLLNVYAHDTSWARGKTRENDFGPPPVFAWEGTNDAPTHARLNFAFFDHYDRVLQEMYARGMTAHIMLKVYNKMVNWPAPRSPEDDLFFDYVVRRYQAFPNIVWDFSKEGFREPDKQYIFDRLARVRALDAYGHLTTVHDDDQFIRDKTLNRAVDFITDQQHSNYYDTIIAQRALEIGPVVNAEFGYEHGRGGPEDKTYPHRVVGPRDMLARACEILMAGGYPVHYYSNHAWDVLEWDEMPLSLEAFGRLSAFFTSFPWYTLAPQPGRGEGGLRCLTDGAGHLVLFARNASGHLLPPAGWRGTRWRGYWLDLWTGAREEFSLEFGPEVSRLRIDAPFASGLALAHLTLVSGRADLPDAEEAGAMQAVFPRGTWQTAAPHALGLDADALEALAAELGGRGCVVKNGYVVHAWGAQPEKSDWMSSAKPVLSTLLLFAFHEGLINSLDVPVKDFGWDLKPKDAPMTLRHLANMVSGYARPEPPGMAWAYNDFAINLYQKTLFDHIFQAEPETVAHHPARLGALGLEDGLSFRESNRRMRASVRDFARIAWFWLNEGNWDGIQLLPQDLMREAMRPHVPAGLPHTAEADTSDYLGIGSYGGGSDHFTRFGPGIYGFNWWFNATGRLHPNGLTWPDAPRDTIMSIGAGGNCAALLPSHNAVLVAAGADWGPLRAGDATARMNAILAQFAQAVHTSD